MQSRNARVAWHPPHDSQRVVKAIRAVDKRGQSIRADRGESHPLERPHDHAREHHEIFHKPFPSMSADVILASGSVIRRLLLEGVGLEFAVVRPTVDEEALKASFAGTTEAMAVMLAEAKARNISTRAPGAVVIGSDSIAECRGRRFDKPTDRPGAAEHLRFFSGKALSLVSAVVLLRDGIVEWAHVERARLWLRSLSEPFIEAYLDAEWPDVGQCVGVFRMEGRGATLFERVEGSHFTILGLPLLPLLGALRDRDVMTS